MNHCNLVVVHFNPYAGGKFFINCLAHNPGILPGLCIASPIHTYDNWLFENVDNIEFRKIERINSTIPPPEDMLIWPSYELGCNGFWGAGFREIFIDGHTPGAEALKLLNSNICFIVNHQVADTIVEKCIDLCPNARHIILYNHTNFQKKASEIKSPDCQLSQMNTVPFDSNFFYLDVDNTYTDLNTVKNAVNRCIKWMKIDNNLHNNINSYVTRYLDLHQ
jgi:hypothetical protein